MYSPPTPGCPLVKERPKNYAWDVSNDYRKGIAADLELLAEPPDFKLPDAWKGWPARSKHKGFRYLWNVSPDKPANWLTDDPNRVLFPYNVNDKDTRYGFREEVRRPEGRADLLRSVHYADLPRGGRGRLCDRSHDR